MKVATNIVIQNVVLKGPFQGQFKNKDGSPKEFNVLEVQAGENKYTRFQSDDKMEVTTGDKVNIAYETKQGKFGEERIIKSVEVLESDSESAPFEVEKSDMNVAKSTPPVARQATANTVSKDTSMEVSGLLQALVNSGTPTEEIETRLRNLLNLKRKIAAELEQKGSV